MALTFFCKNCGKQFTVDESMAGRHGRCKQCGHEFDIPKVPPAAQPAPITADVYIGTLQPVAVMPAKTNQTSPAEFAWLGPITKYALLAGAAVWLIGIILAACRIGLGAMAALGGVFLIGMLMVSTGGITSLIVPFFESAVQGLLCFFVPFYQLYYLITRWQPMKRPFLLWLGGIALLGGAGLMFALLPTNREPVALADRPEAAESDAPANPAAPGEGPAETPEATEAQAPPVNPQDPAAVPVRSMPGGAPPFFRRPRGNTAAGDAFVDEVLVSLRSPQLGDQRRALRRLRGVPPTDRSVEVAKAVEPLLQDPDGFTRSDAARALAVWGGPENIPALIDALRDPSFGVRWAVLDTLKALKDPSSVPALVEVLATNDAGKAAEALKAIGSGAEDAVIPCLRESGARCREACNILKVIGTEKSIPELRALALTTGFESHFAREALKEIARRTNAADAYFDPR
jgi:hypothetical protein